MTDRNTEITSALTEGEQATQAAETTLASKPGRREVTRIAVVAAMAASLLMCGVSVAISTLAYSSAAETSAAQQAQAKEFESNKKLAQQAYDSAREANAALIARGQAPVSIPAPGNDSAAFGDTLVASAAAQVLAQLGTRPTSAELGRGIAEYFVANPITPAGPSPGLISSALAGYLQTNPPLSGEPGKPGENGSNGEDGADGKDGADAPPVTDADIQRSFVDYVTANPGFLPRELCRAFGDNFNEAKDLTASDGRQFTLYGCITEVKPAPETTVVTPTSSSRGRPTP